MKYFKLFIIGLLILAFQNFSAQDERNSYLYKGTVDNIPVALYLVENITGCPTTYYLGMYKYDKMNSWMELEISDDEDSKLIMIEQGLTGILSVIKKGDTLSGVWMSPDGKKILKVYLKKVPLNNQSKQTYEDTLDNVQYQNHDC